jgi:cytochrome c553
MLRVIRLFAALFAGIAALAACSPETVEVTRIVTQENTVEVEVTREVEVEVTRLVEVVRIIAGDPERGRDIFETGGGILGHPCQSCHTLDGTLKRRGGPSLMGISAAASDRVPELSAAGYLLQSIVEPDAYLAEGFEVEMPKSYPILLSEEDIDALVAYLLTQ